MRSLFCPCKYLPNRLLCREKSLLSMQMNLTNEVSSSQISWEHAYRHWVFKPRKGHWNSSLSKKVLNKKAPQLLYCVIDTQLS